MKKSIYLLLIFTAIIFTGCQPKKELTTADFSNVTTGMSTSEVTDLLGKPDEIEKNLDSERVAKQLDPFKQFVEPMKEEIEGGDELVEQLTDTLDKIKDKVAITYYVYNYDSSTSDDDIAVTMVFCDDELTLKLIEENFNNMDELELGD
ncbi:hypothetical protein ACWN8V_12170 [Vagococcus elongatus]|uniref:Uncharacterized protein n=1 Tax=Vagococcus elongatus TaxID=180344 RepID=A0A430AM15_9ENTE|nr:hypothetical protein [Vagococcus elongatus]RSU09190.1 hypothetical protein CBF29_12030 [Vagococcus elongatus]